MNAPSDSKPPIMIRPAPNAEASRAAETAARYASALARTYWHAAHAIGHGYVNEGLVSLSRAAGPTEQFLCFLDAVEEHPQWLAPELLRDVTDVRDTLEESLMRMRSAMHADELIRVLLAARQGVAKQLERYAGLADEVHQAFARPLPLFTAAAA